MYDIRLGERTSPAETQLNPTTQAEGFRIGGRILDEKGKPLQDAVVSVLDTGLETRTDNDGRYLLGLLQPGHYELRINSQSQTIPVEVPDPKQKADSTADIQK